MSETPNESNMAEERYKQRQHEEEEREFEILRAQNERERVRRLEVAFRDAIEELGRRGNQLFDRRKTIEAHEATIATQAAALEVQSLTIAALKQQVAQRDELIRITGDTCERYKTAIEDARQALSNQTHGGAQYQPDVLEADSILANALAETASNEDEAD